jgi:2-polyprenyl-3-methyl-5-hydroxy-6-metoxy-1,4-benzoquinol methylase
VKIGPAVRRRLGRFETTVAEAYRTVFFNVDDFGRVTRSLVPSAARILEIGCGDGSVADRVSRLYPLADYTGIDIAPEPGRRFQGDCTRVTFAKVTSGELRSSLPEAFDLILIVDVLHHIPADDDRASVIADAVAMLAPQGTLLVKEWEVIAGLPYAAGYLADRFVSGDKLVRYMDWTTLTSIISRGAPELIPAWSTSVRPWRCNMVRAYMRG